MPSVVAIRRARTLLERGRQEAEERRVRRRRWSAASGLVAIPSIWAARRSRPLSRRGFVHKIWGGVAALALAFCGSGYWLAEVFGGEEEAGYDLALRRLDAIEAADRAL